MLQLVLNAAARVFTRTRSIYPPSAWIMEKPCILTTMFGPQNVYEDFKPCIEKHFTIIKYEDFVERKEHLAGKIRAIFLFGTDLEVNMELLQALPNLQAVVNGGVGVDHLDIPLIKSFGMKVCNTPHVVDNATADLGIALMLASSRRIIEGHNFSKYHELEYMPKCFGNDVSGATLGIIGMGRIGYKVAKRAQGFDMRILYHNRNQSLTPQTHKLIGAKELAMMKPSSTLINISRGLVVDQDALVDALKKKVIRAAALDVTYPEPLPNFVYNVHCYRNHPLLSFPNVIVLPHMGTDTVETIQAMLEKMVVNTLAVLNGEQPPDEVHV
ncbi:glyoxylate/hydroxypyruvate reductase B isoform X4 [Neoarius graeffei]|uniref:glyoxylate/hydroxypyruvate reductase B isoform X4 n=1 Tax=Neoarius graeffei TaxID=443677 RepID=UPI00298CE44E|nr:glyoxylate/hydroxypyruvate reductase B isoform X4 [Neoarius graeffei]